jgi:lipopolysaccharide/colanic/teichoic acid biosynthesis glycosyltransferase
MHSLYLISSSRARRIRSVARAPIQSPVWLTDTEPSAQARRAAPKVKPGITGWAQVNGLRGETDARPHPYDIDTIRNWSLMSDLMIIGKTLAVVVGGIRTHLVVHF